MSDKAYKIILLDDDRFLLDMYSVKFAKEGHTVQSCVSVDEAIHMIEGGFDPDAVVFDLVMPSKDGFDLLREIHEKKIAPRATLVALTNQSSDEEQKRAQELGAHEYIIKASTIPSEVVNTIVTAIGAHSRA